jgi:hypothetical protein
MTMLAVVWTSAVHAMEPPIVVTGPEQKQLDPSLPDGGLPWYPGVANIQIFRASRSAKEITDGKGWTYNHHLDLAVWRGRMYCAWNQCEKDEDVWPSREVYSTSTDGVHWSDPHELFPMGVSAAERMYFFHAPNGRMLAIACYRAEKDHARVAGALVVREIKPDHTLGDVFTLQAPKDTSQINLQANALYDTAADEGFVNACEALLSNKPFLEQADYGAQVGDRRMKWHDVNTWPADEPSRAEFPHRFGKAMCFYHRKDGALVAVMKWGWVLVSHDEGETWSSPVRPPTLVAGMAKLWGQRTTDGKYVLAYNPHLENRWPLMLVTGDDGITFGQMRVIHPELPPIRYEGRYKVPGPQYMRGVSEWSTDGSFKDDATWIAYSMSKEDIWIARVPFSGGPQGRALDAWNTYSPKWAPVTVENESLTLEDRDPVDYARATRLIQPAKKIEVTFDLTIDEATNAPLFVDLLGPKQFRVARISIDAKNRVRGNTMTVKITADCSSQTCTATIDNQMLPVSTSEKRTGIIAVSLQTGERVVKIDPEMDRPVPRAKYHVTGFRLIPSP